MSRALQPRVKRERSSRVALKPESSSATWHFRCKATDSGAGKRNIYIYMYIHTHILLATRRSVCRIVSVLHALAILDRYFLAELYPTNLIENQNQNGDGKEIWEITPKDKSLAKSYIILSPKYNIILPKYKMKINILYMEKMILLKYLKI